MKKLFPLKDCPMTSLRISAAALGLSSSMLAFLPATAFALDAEQFGARLQALTASQGADLKWTDMTVDGATVTLEGVTAGVPGEELRVPLGRLVLEDVTEEDGGFNVGSFSIPSYSFSDDDATVAVQGLTITGLTLPGEGSAGPLSGLMMYETAEVENVTVRAKEAEVFSMSGLSAEITAPEGEEPLDIAISVEEFSADLSQAKDPKAKEAVAALGYSTISGDMEIAAQWTPADGRATLEQMDITVADAGTLSLSVDVGGYTPELARTVQELQAKMTNVSDEEKSAQGLAMLGLMQQLTFRGATIRFTDDSLTDKLLGYTAARQNLKRDDVVNLAKAVLPLYLSQLGNPEFTASVTTAVSTFLDNPGSFAITAQPTDPVPFAMVFAGAVAAPQSLVGQLGVSVTATETP